MGVYRERVVPRLIDRACSTPDVARLRDRVTAGLSGTILEIGFGSGLNLAHYPPEVHSVAAVEPAMTARRLAEPRVEASHVEVRHVGLRGEEIPLPDRSCDGALSTFTLCTIPDVSAALAEIHRVVRPGGAFHFLEHGRSPDAGVARWQSRLDPLQRRLCDGCHLTRDPVALVRDAGFELVEIDQDYTRGPKPWVWVTVGRARRP
jgi:SAM-dependent methyltransferase